MNVYDSERMADLMAPLGYSLSGDSEDADFVILNTCHIREKASEKTFSELGRLRVQQGEKALKGERMLVAVAGCVAQAEGAEILRRAPYVDMVFGPQSYHRLPEMVARAVRSTGGQLETDFPVEAKFDFLPDQKASSPGLSAFLTVQEGCDKFCTFCVVPYTRGAEFSRPVVSVVEEAKRLADQGVRELTLLGQNVNGYHGEGPDGKSWNLAKLLALLAEIPGIIRLRYTTSHPRDMDDDLIAAHRDIEAVMPYLHLPVQSGSDRILEKMNRRHKAADFLAIIEKLRRARPDIALSSDFITGFPGETDHDFGQTMELVRQIGFAQAYSFKYSPRPGTPASIEEDQVPEIVKSERLAQLQELLIAQQRQFNEKTIGQKVSVLFEREGRHDGQLIGRTPHNQAVYVSAGAEAFGRLLEVQIERAGQNSLTGRLVGMPLDDGRLHAA